MKKILWIGDGPDCPSGFGRATREILNGLDHRAGRGGEFEATCLGINAGGDPSELPYRTYACFLGGDMFGVGRMVWMCDHVKPDVVIVQQDGWNIPLYVRQLRQFVEYKDVPIVAAVAVDGKNFNGKWLDGVALAIFWTQFALDEARAGGYEGPATVIPLGVDLATYYPMDRKKARVERGFPESMADSFLVGNVNRNQIRKRWDLTVKLFARWVNEDKVSDAFLFMHTAPTGDEGIDVKRLALYYGVHERLALVEPPTHYGISENGMRDSFCSMDVLASTTMGEGMGLGALEAMACEVPCILPDWSGYGSWARHAADLVPCNSTMIAPSAVGAPCYNVIGGVVDEAAFVEELRALYATKALRDKWGRAGLARVSEERFRWEHIAGRYAAELNELLGVTQSNVLAFEAKLA